MDPSGHLHAGSKGHFRRTKPHSGAINDGWSGYTIRLVCCTTRTGFRSELKMTAFHVHFRTQQHILTAPGTTPSFTQLTVTSWKFTKSLLVYFTVRKLFESLEYFCKSSVKLEDNCWQRNTDVRQCWKPGVVPPEACRRRHWWTQEQKQQQKCKTFNIAIFFMTNTNCNTRKLGVSLVNIRLKAFRCLLYHLSGFYAFNVEHAQGCTCLDQYSINMSIFKWSIQLKVWFHVHQIAIHLEFLLRSENVLM